MKHRSIALATILAAAAAARGQDVVVDFDQVSAPGAFGQISPGFDNGPLVKFPGGQIDHGVILRDVLFGNSATSGQNIYASCDGCGLADIPNPTTLPGRVLGAFDAGVEVDAIDLDVINGSTAGGGTYTLTAYDSGGAVVDQRSVFCNTMNVPGFIQHLSVSGAGIRTFEVTANAPAGYSFAIDTLVYHEPECPSQGVLFGTGCAGGGTQPIPSLAMTGCALPGDAVFLHVTNGLGGSTAIYHFGLAQAALPMGFDCTLNVQPLLPLALLVPLGGTGPGNGEALIAGTLPPSASGVKFTTQAFVLDPSVPMGATATNGLEIDIP